MTTRTTDADPIVFVVDDDPAACHAVVELVRTFGQRAEAYTSAAEFLKRLDEVPVGHIGCIAFDLRMTGIDGLELYQRVSERDLSLPAICITAYAETASTVKMLRSGVLAVLDKPFRENELWSFVQEALAKSETDQRRRTHRRALEQRLKQLAPPDRQVLQLVLEGCKNRTMAKRLGVGLRTVENRRRRIFEVMQTESVAELARLVAEYEHRLLPALPGSEAWLALPFEPVA